MAIPHVLVASGDAGTAAILRATDWAIATAKGWPLLGAVFVVGLVVAFALVALASVMVGAGAPPHPSDALLPCEPIDPSGLYDFRSEHECGSMIPFKPVHRDKTVVHS